MREQRAPWVINGGWNVLFGAALLAWFCCTSAPLRAQNPIVTENALTGNLPSEWDITGIGDPSIQGFSTEFSVNRGQTVSFKIDTNASAYRIDIYRLGYYGGRGARKVATVNPSVTLPQIQPQFLRDATTGMADCGNWAVSASWAVPSTATSGVYIAKLVRTDTGGASHIVFVVRNDTGNSALLFQTSDTTWHAYNTYGGASLYQGNGPAGRSYQVSYNRPFDNRGATAMAAAESYVFNSEFPMIRWLEANGYDVSYAAGVDTDRRGSAALLTHKVFLSVGHDEYWSAGQRANVETARGAGVHLGFFTGNEMFWKTRWANSISSPSTAYRSLVCYKETYAHAKIDPTSTWTGTWRDPRFSPPADGGRPENAVTGQLFMVNGMRNDVLRISPKYGKLRFWRNTGLDALSGNQLAELPAGILGYEWNEPLDNGFQPAGLIRLSSTTLPVNGFYLQDYGTVYGTGVGTHSLTLYRHSSGALVFAAGTTQWPWGLDATHDFPGTPADPRVQQATVNLFADMGVQPATLRPGLVPAVASSDLLPPVSVIQIPGGLSVPAWSPFTVYGTATDLGGGRPAAVEVSADGGATWHPANGTTNWSAELTLGGPGVLTIKSRAIDDSGRIESPGQTATVTVTNGSFKSSLWSPTDAPIIVDQDEVASVELGVMFNTERDGWITALRFYKSPANTGVHVGNLWANNGTLLASVTFTNETPSGWQQADLPTPVAIAAGNSYVASYHTDAGHYSRDPFYFSGRSVDSPPLHAPADGVSGFNGRYVYGESAYPAFTSQSANYWVDVVYTSSLGADVIAPLVIDRVPVDGTLDAGPGAEVSATFNEPLGAGTVSAATFVLRDAQNNVVPAAVTYDSASRTARLQPAAPLTVGTSYTATVKGGVSGVGDLIGNRLISDSVWSFTVAPPPGVANTLWSADTAPNVVDGGDSQAAEVGVRFRADLDGSITALRFYKSAANTGVHVGNLWSSEGVLLGSVTFAGETASGWQQAALPTPVPITAGTTYVASYFAPNGRYAVDSLYFSGYGVDRGPLHAPAETATESNGVIAYGASAFPSNSTPGNNYWVDVVFASRNQVAAPAFTPPGGTYSSGPSVALSTPTPGAQIHYTTDGSTPTTSSAVYASPIAVAANSTVRAIAAAAGWYPSTVASATYTISPGPLAPTGLAGVALSTNQINLTWTDNAADETGFKIERRLGVGGTFAQIATVGANVVAYSDTTASEATTYVYRVRATNALGDSVYSNETTVTSSALTAGAAGLQGDYYDNSNLTNFKLARIDTTVGFNWGNSAPATGVGQDTFSVRWTGRVEPLYSQTYTFYTSSDDGIRLWVNGQQIINNWTDHGTTENSGTIALEANRLYDVVLEYYENAGGAVAQLSWSSASQAKQIIPSNRLYTTYPKAPISLTATATSTTQINLAWSDASNNEGGFKIERSLNGSAFTEIATVGPNVVTYSSTGLSVNTAYTYRVRGYSVVGNSDYSNSATATTMNTAPAAPSGLTATAVSGSQINLSWVDNSSNETGFKIERKTGSGGTYAQVGTVGAGVTTYSSGGLTATTTYFYRVRATNAVGDSGYSSQASATTLSTPPAAPTGLTATANSSTQISLAWADVSNETGYKIERKTGAGGTYAQIATVGAGVTTYANTGLTAATAYFYRVRATNAVGDSDYSAETSATTLPPAPSAPSGLAANPVSSSQINLTWVDNANNETGFKIERKTGAGGSYVQIDSVGANVTAYSNAGLASATTYFYRVRATNTGGDSAFSAETSAVTMDVPPTAPSGLAATAASSSQINLSWVDNSTNETGFKIEQKTGAAGSYSQIATVAAGVTTYSSVGLSVETTYYFRIRAANSVGDSAYSAEATSTTLPAPPAAPSGLSAVAASATQITLSWGDNSTNETGFKIERKTGAAGTYAQIGTVGAGVVAFNDTGLAANTAYYYRVRASNAGGDSAYSNEANATTLNVAPAAPGALTATPVSTSQINLSWADNSTNETGFKIERKTGSGGTYAQIATVGQNVSTYSDTGLAATTAYFYRVRATNTVGDSAYSAEASGTTLANVPAAPSGLDASPISSTQVNLTWVDNSPNETGFKIERKTGAGGTYAQIATVGAGVTSYSNTGLTLATTYVYRVRATNASGDSSYSAEASATTTAPAFRAAASKGAASGTLTINKPAGTLSGDVMVASIAIRPSTATINASGWTLVRRTNNTSGNSSALAVYYKVAGASEPSTYSWTFSSSTGSAGGIRAFSGVDTSSPVDVEGGRTTSSSLSHPTPSVTTRFAGSMIVTSHEFSSSATFTPPSGMAEAFDISSQTSMGSGGVAIEGAYQLQLAVAATGTKTATASNDADTGNTHILALKAK